MKKLELTLPIKINPTENGGYVITDAEESEYFFYVDKESGKLVYDGCCVTVENKQIVFEQLNQNNMSQFKVIPVEIYTTDIVVSVGQTDDELYDELKIRFTKEEFEHAYMTCLDKRSDACFVIKDGFPIIRFFDNDPDYGLIAHECFHAVYCILNSKRIELCQETEEVYAYLLQYLVNKIKKEN